MDFLTLTFSKKMLISSHLNMLQGFVWPKIKQKRLYFQQDGAAAHYAITVREWLDAKMPNRWIGWRSPFEWPARSPDLTPCDFRLWGYLKQIVYQNQSTTLEELQDRIRMACREINNEFCKNCCHAVIDRFRDCLERGGIQLNYLKKFLHHVSL